MAESTQRCLGQCGLDGVVVCAKSGKCEKCCDNECGCGFELLASESRYDNLCEAKWLKSQPEVQ